VYISASELFLVSEGCLGALGETAKLEKLYVSVLEK